MTYFGNGIREVTATLEAEQPGLSISGSHPAADAITQRMASSYPRVSAELPIAHATVSDMTDDDLDLPRREAAERRSDYYQHRKCPGT